MKKRHLLTLTAGLGIGYFLIKTEKGKEIKSTLINNINFIKEEYPEVTSKIKEKIQDKINDNILNFEEPIVFSFKDFNVDEEESELK